MSRYQLGSRIATGGMGEVWRAEDTVLGRQVAIKMLKPEYAGDATFRSRFETEARNAASLHHPNVASVFDFGEDFTAGDGPPRPYLVMELVEGRPLSELIRPDRPMPADRAVGLVAQAGDALAAAHAAGIVHRDVKPANLLVRPDGTVKVTDFGIARAADAMSLTGTGEVIGTPTYLSPEQAEGRTATPASDVYSLAVVLYECLTGTRPYSADTPVATALAHVRNPVPELPASVPPDLARVVRRAMAKDPAARFADAGAFAAAIRDPAAVPGVSDDGSATRVLPVTDPEQATQQMTQPMNQAMTPPIAPEPVAEPSTHAAERHRGRAAWWAAAAVVVVVLVVGAVVLLTRGSTDKGAAKTVRIDAGDYIGLTEKQATDQLTGLGFDDVQTERQANPGDKTKGRVASISPRGDVATDATITLSLWGPAPRPSPSPSAESSPSPSGSTSPSTSPSPSPSPSPSETTTPTPTQSPSGSPSGSASATGATP